MVQIKMDLIKWKNLLTHPSEFVRIDEQLRLKQIELFAFNDTVDGWTKISAQENLEHQRLLYSMRCYLSITCNSIFSVNMLSKGEFQSLKHSFIDRDNIITAEDQDYATLNALSQNEYWLILTLSSDRYNTERIYRKIIGKIIQSYEPLLDYHLKENLIETIVKKCFFTVQ